MAHDENRWKDEARNRDEDVRRDVRDRHEIGRSAYGSGGCSGNDYESGGYEDRDPSRRWGSDWGHAERGWRRDGRVRDDRLRDDLNDRLTEAPHIDATDIAFSVSGDSVAF